MEYKVIKTGSKGNAILIDKCILIDCGVPFDMLKDYYKDLKLVFITHEHGDHFNKITIKKLTQERPTLKFVVGEYLVSKLYKCNVIPQNIFLLEFGKWYDLGILKCQITELTHDVPNSAIHIIKNNEKLVYATDTSNVNNLIAKDYDYYLLEGNYKEEELEKRKEQKILNGKFVIENRIANSHLSYEQCIDFFIKNSKDSSILEVLHQHIEKGEKIDE